VRTGIVKWFDPGRGFGFVAPDGGGPDVLLHANVLRAFGQSSVPDGARIVMDVAQGARGLQAVRVVDVEIGDAPRPVDPAELPEYLRPYPDDLPLEPARVKWFDRSKGFGFANVWRDAADVFVHAEVLRRCGLAELATGEAICLRAVEGGRGRLAVEVRRWDGHDG
jgi:CspA family cold shock protein